MKKIKCALIGPGNIGTDLLAKLLSQELPAVQVVWLRQSGLFVGVMVLLALRAPFLLVVAGAATTAALLRLLTG